MTTLNSNLNMKTGKELTKGSSLLLFLASIFLSWKLIRLAYPIEILWNAHNYLIILLSLISICLSLKYNLYLERSRTAVVVLFFILLSIARLAIFPQADPFFMASSVFCLYFIMVTFIMKHSIELGFKYFEALLILLLIYCAIDYFDANNPFTSIFIYKVPLFMDGSLGALGHKSQSLFSVSMADGFIVRSIGVAGTNYASSSLVAASSIYFFIVKRRILFTLSVVLLILWGVGSSLFGLVVAMSFLFKRSKWIVAVIPFCVLAIYFLFVSRGWDPSHLFQITNNFGATSFLAASLLGEGKSISSLHSEFRVLGLIFSLGFVGVSLILCMTINYINLSRYAKLYDDVHYRAGLYFMSVLLITTFHYNTFFVFPNIFFFVMLIALSSVGFIRMREDSIVPLKN
jgi:hypothetical protein